MNTVFLITFCDCLSTAWISVTKHCQAMNTSGTAHLGSLWLLSVQKTWHNVSESRQKTKKNFLPCQRGRAFCQSCLHRYTPGRPGDPRASSPLEPSHQNGIKLHTGCEQQTSLLLNTFKVKFCLGQWFECPILLQTKWFKCLVLLNANLIQMSNSA